EDLARRLQELGGAKAVFTTHSETSTGVVADVQALAAAAKDAGALVVVDAVSSLGAVPVETDAWGLDAVISGSQKALMTPPGLATVSVSEDAWAAVEQGAASRYYFDWGQTRDRRPPAGGGARGGVRAPGPPRPCLPRRRQSDGARAVLTRRRPLRRRHGDQRARRDRLERARPDAARPPGHRPCAGTGAAQGEGLPHRPHRLLRRLRHHDRPRRCRAGSRRAGRRHRARRRYHRRPRGVRTRQGLTGRPRVLVREPIAEAG